VASGSPVIMPSRLQYRHFLPSKPFSHPAVPHEIGDFTMLVSAGMSKWEAISAQFITAGFAFAGTALGVWGGLLHKNISTALVSITAGGFVYIATGMLAMQGPGTNALTKGERCSNIIFEGFAFVTGVAVMVAVALLE
jgi:zinc transporter ZupT